jgi:SAM-dependent methyltransferase
MTVRKSLFHANGHGAATVTAGSRSAQAVEHWDSYIDAAGILRALGCGHWSGDLVEFGCGYGTFTISAAQRVSGTVHALDMDPLMVAATKWRVARLGLKNVFVEQRDFIATGCGREPRSASSALLFNILEFEDPVGLLKEAHRVLRSGGLVGVIHWNVDRRIANRPLRNIRPRPDIQPRPEQCRAWGELAGLRWVRDAGLPLGSPRHWGMVLEKP